MDVYVGQTRSKKLIKRLEALGMGECCNRGEFPPRRVPYFLDNGAFKDWRAGKEWKSVPWLKDVARARVHHTRPVFAVVPDVVAGGTSSLEWSLRWLPMLQGIPAYLAVQDGMTATDVGAALSQGEFAGLFVGGSLPWKLRTGSEWVAFAHFSGLPCHIGRVGTAKRVMWAHEIGADSIDSCLPLWSEAQLQRFLGAIKRAEWEEAHQTRLFE